ncbi:MAG: NAD-dependent epimerase/dehydratase family protein [Gemmatimonadales bacterium]|nr:NAD-dependent epimerase/dehydratase family protein [Gemmatimonadales bacterium]
MTILVTGGTGFIGRHLTRALLARGERVRLLDLVPRPAPPDGVELVTGDVRDPAACARAVAGCSRVFHLAAAHYDFGISERTFYGVNEAGTRTLAEACGAAGVTDLVFTSTVATYGDVPEPKTEDGPCRPDTPYGASKLAGERVLQQWAAADPARRALVVRPAVVFGTDNFTNVFRLIRQIHRRLFLQVGPGRNIKSLAYVENLVAAMLYLADRPARGAFEVFNACDEPHLTSRQIVAAIHRALGRGEPGAGLPLGLATTLALPFDLVTKVTGKDLGISSARIIKVAETQTRFERTKLEAAGFRQPVPIEEGLARMVRWYLERGHALNADLRYPPEDVAPAA